jgi:hypothetical protein
MLKGPSDASISKAHSEMRRLEALMGPTDPHKSAAASFVDAFAASPATPADAEDDRASVATSGVFSGWPKDTSKLDPEVVKSMRAEYRKNYKQARNKETAAATRTRCERRMAELLAEVVSAAELA